MKDNLVTSFRLKPEVKQQLEYVARVLHRRKNWIITQALQEYLNALNSQVLQEEARRQSLLASRAANQDEKLWEDNHDTTDWQ